MKSTIHDTRVDAVDGGISLQLRSRRRGAMRTGLIMLSTLALLFSSQPAFANEAGEAGWNLCKNGKYGRVQTYAKGQISITPPGDYAVGVFNTGNSWKTIYRTASKPGGGGWSVFATVGLAADKTYPTCINFIPFT